MLLFPNAKINLGLKIVAKRSDGYHLLQTVFYPVKLADVLEVIPSETFELYETGLSSGVPAEKNLVFKAYQLMREEYSVGAVKLFLHKNIPNGAGLGGGSSDAAFMIKALNVLFELNLSLQTMENLAAKIGADCAFFVRNTPVFATGIGNVFTDIKLSLKDYKIAIVKPHFSISTKEAFSLVKPQKSEIDLTKIATLHPSLWKDFVVNDFELYLFKKYPQLQEVKEYLYRNGAIYASMTGSGSAFYGIFPKDFSGFDESFDGFVWLEPDDF